MSRYQLTAQAQEDLIQIRKFTLENWGIKQSHNYLEKLKQTLILLAEIPLMGKNCSAELDKELYRFLFKNHAIYYFIAKNAIIVIAILHQRMIPANHLANRV